MSQMDPEQVRLQEALRDHSDQFLETLDHIGTLEAEDRTKPIGSADFGETAHDVRLAADRLREIAESQEKIGDGAVTSDVTIDDVPGTAERQRR